MPFKDPEIRRQKGIVACRRYRVRHPEKWAATLLRSRLKTKYGMTVPEFEAMVAAQNGLCAGCGLPPDQQGLAVDHDHTTKKVRALLCQPCNRTIGHAKEDPVRLRALISYLEKFG